MNTDSPQIHLFSIREAAHYLGVSRSTIYRLIAEDQLDVVEIRGRRLIGKNVLDELIEQSIRRGEIPD